MYIEESGYFISRNFFKSTVTPERHAPLFELELYIKGDGYTVVDGRKIRHSPGNIIFARPGQKRNSIGSFEAYYVKFHVTEESITKYTDKIKTLTSCVDITEYKKYFLDLIYVQNKKEPGYELYMQGLVLALISRLYGMTVNKVDFDKKYLPYKKNILEAKSYCEMNIDKRITVSDMAKAADLSESYFYVVFKNITGISPHEFLLQMRLEKVKFMLAATNTGIEEISSLCGFESQSYLNYIFKKKFDITPKKYRDKKTEYQ